MAPDQMLVRFMVVCNFAVKRMLVFHFFQEIKCVFGGVISGGRFNLIVLPELGSFTSKDIPEGKILGKFAGQNCYVCIFPCSIFSFVKKYLIF